MSKAWQNNEKKKKSRIQASVNAPSNEQQDMRETLLQKSPGTRKPGGSSSPKERLN